MLGNAADVGCVEGQFRRSESLVVTRDAVAIKECAMGRNGG
jgi:hypothetical protein